MKPANLVIREQGNQRQGVVTDLGLASKFDEAGRAFSSRHARIYRPPEVWANAGYSAKSDVYQLGIVFFQLLGGSLNHDLGNLDDPDLADLVVSGRLIDVSSVGPDVDSALRKVIKTATAPENERYASMSDFLVALNNAKLQQLDWVFSVTEDGFALERRSGRDTYRVEVEIEGDLHRVKRRRAGPTGVFRAKNPIAEIIHKDIGSCRKFRQIIEW